MASMTMTASFLGGATSTVTKNPSIGGPRRGLVVASRATEGEKTSSEESSSGRRDLVFAATAAAAAFSVAKLALAIDEPKKGTPEAKKKYAPICVTMPTARICHK